jgi:DNA-binding CsgD family transcriptional regulator
VPDDDEHALAVYHALRAHGGLPRTGVARAAELDAEQTRRGLDRLLELGLVQATGGVLQPVEPDTALIRTVDAYRTGAVRRAADAAALQRLADSLLTVYRPVVGRDAARVEVEYISDRHRKDRTRQYLVAGARETCDSVHPGPLPPVRVLEEALRFDRSMVERGVRVREVYPRSITGVPRYASFLRQLSETGAQVRLLDHVAYDMMLVDRLAACLPADPDRPSGARLLVRGSALVKLHAATFDDCWLRAVPYAEHTANPPRTALTPQERVVVKLMAGGLSDDQIARRMGIHRRTVQRAIAKLMERLGAASRFEAGLLLAQDREFARAVRTGAAGPDPGARTG